MKMGLQILQTFLVYIIVFVCAFEDLIYVYGQGNQEMLEQGRAQYQLIKERGTLPKYGTCWKSAIQHLNEGCRHLSEDTQSDIALHITNCFLEMSGHETYNCELDKKPNLRGICINSMSDRAFNVYTEFYTHTQNICWFLRGQIWHETIAENTLKVGRQLEVTAENQESLLRAQKHSLELQEKMLKHGKFLEEVLEDLYVSTKAHQELLKILAQSVSNLQSWIVGEISWIDSIIFYAFSIFLTFILTSSHRTISARLPLFFLLFFNLLIERYICSFMLKNNDEFDTKNLYSNIYDFVWYSRYAFIFLACFILIYRAFMFRDIMEQNNELLNMIQKQNSTILESLLNLKSNTSSPDKSNLNIVNENSSRKSLENKINNLNYKESNYSSYESNVGKYSYYSPNLNGSYRENGADLKENLLGKNSSKRRLFPLSELQNNRYNLRTRQGTPDSNFG